MLEQMPDRMPDRTPEMSEQMPDRMSEQMPDRMPDRMPEQNARIECQKIYAIYGPCIINILPDEMSETMTKQCDGGDD